MATGYKPQTLVDWTSKEAYTQFRRWKKEVERIVGGPLADATAAVQLNHVYIWAGAHAEQLVEARQSEDPELTIDTVNKLLSCLEECLTHTTHFREAREDFYNAKQIPGENTTTFYSRILELHRQAQFPANSNFLITDKLIHGCINIECKRKLMGFGKDVTVKVCLNTLRQHEAIDVTMQHFSDVQITPTYTHDPTKRSQRKGSKSFHRQPKNQQAYQSHKGTSKRICGWCGGITHKKQDCPAREAQCHYCNKKGHYSKVCHQKTYEKQANTVEADCQSITDSEDDFDYLEQSTVVASKVAREIVADVTFYGSQQQTIPGKVDTGAMVTCMPQSLLQDIHINLKDIEPTKMKLRGVTGTDMKAIGSLTLKDTCNGGTHHTTIVITELGTELILGLDFCHTFKLIHIADSCMLRSINSDIDAVHITEESDYDYNGLRRKWMKYLPLGKSIGDAFLDLNNIFPDMFDETVGRFEGEAELKLSPDSKPVQLPPRAVPHSTLPKLKMELDKMEKDGIIRECPEATDWDHNLVIVTKKNGDLRLCLDPKNLNQGFIRNLHYTASWDDAQSTFNNGRFFSTLDAKSGYWTQKLSPESQLLTAFNTPFKKYCSPLVFLYLPKYIRLKWTKH